VSLVAHEPDAVDAMVRAAKAAARKPLIAKLSPDVTDLIPVAQAAERAGAAALTLGNTYVGMSVDPDTRRSRLGTLTGGLSGPAIRPLAVYRVWYTANSVSIPIIGLGGIVRAEDALEFFMAGAAAVAVGTASFADPRAPLRVLRGLERYCERRGVASLSALRAGALG
jgi:dihydroorotate dehydrogenase (NAD+) catalytic subunit